MEFRNLKQQYQMLRDRIDKVVLEVMTDCNFIRGEQVVELERQLAEYVGVKHCITCGNGTDALSMVLMAWGVGSGDAVFIPDFTFFATGEVVAFAGATPIFVDVDEDTFNLSPDSLERAIIAVIAEGKLKPKVVIPVDLFGLPADYDRINSIANRYGLKVLEDAAQGFGGIYKGKRACSLGDAATTSFFPAKPLGCYGDGGAIFTNNDQDAEILRSIAVHGKGSFKYDNIRVGRNSRLDTIQAAILLVKLDAFKEFELKEVDKVASWYNEILKGKLKIPEMPEGYSSAWAQYTIQLDNKVQRDEIQSELRRRDIPSMIYYPKPMHKQTAFIDFPLYVECKVTDKLCDTVLSLPLDAGKERLEIELVCETILEGLLGGK